MLFDVKQAFVAVAVLLTVLHALGLLAAERVKDAAADNQRAAARVAELISPHIGERNAAQIVRTDAGRLRDVARIPDKAQVTVGIRRTLDQRVGVAVTDTAGGGLRVCVRSRWEARARCASAIRERR